MNFIEAYGAWNAGRLPCGVDTEPLVGDSRARDVAAQLLKVAALIGSTVHTCVQAEAMRIGAQGTCNRRRAARCVVQAQHFASRARPERDAVSAGCSLQRREQVLRIDDPVRIRHISHALFFDQMPQAGQQPQDAPDDLVEQRLKLLTR